MMRELAFAGLLWSAVLVLGAAAAGTAQETPSPNDATVRIEALSKKVEENPGDVEVLIDLGNLYYETNMLDQALATYLEAVRLDSMHVGARLNLGVLYADMQRFHQAVPELERALRLDPTSALIMTNLGSTYYGAAKYNDAVDMYRRALEADSRNVEAHFNLGVAFADAQIFDEAIREWKTVIEIDPTGSVAKTCRENIAMIEEFRSGR